MRRKYIALVSTLVFMACFVLDRMSESDSTNPNTKATHYFEYPILLLQIVLTGLVFVAKNNDTKNILTCFNFVLTVLYIIYSFIPW
jgi:hypothetical protein